MLDLDSNGIVFEEMTVFGIPYKNFKIRVTLAGIKGDLPEMCAFFCMKGASVFLLRYQNQ